MRRAPKCRALRNAGSTILFSPPFKERPSGVPQSACPMFRNTTCCTATGLTQAGGTSGPLATAVQSALTNILPACQATLQQLYCSVCSPDQDAIFTVQPYEIDLLLCPHFASSIYAACAQAQVDGQTVSARFADAASFLHHIVGTSFHVSIRQSVSCYDPTLPPCTAFDYVGTYSDCVGGVRSAFFQLSPLARCQGGITNPPPVTGLSCTIACLSGSYLPIGSTQCQPCQAGTFSIGGGVHIETWKDWPHGITATNYCLGRYNKSEVKGASCKHWAMNETVIMSGKVGDSVTTIVSLAFELVRPGHVSFRWTVDAELCVFTECDGFYAELDDVRVVNLTSVQPWITSRFAAGKGHHVLTLAFSKDISISKGSDMAMIEELEINGLEWADSSCTQCSPGSFSRAGARNCTVCPFNTATEHAGTPNRCEPCPADMYALVGSSECLPRPLCTQEDFEVLYSGCSDNWTQNEVPQWITPHICAGGVTLPVAQQNLGCFACSPGFHRVRGSGECVGCPNGHKLDGEQCVPCAAGTSAHKVFEVERWDAWPDWVHHQTGLPLSATLEHGCTGEGCLDEWRLMGSYIDSGEGHRFPATSWLNFTVDIEAIPTYFTYNISFAYCTSLLCRASLRVVRTSDGTVIDSDYASVNFDGRRGLRILEPGFHSFLLTFDGAASGSNAVARVHSLRVSGARDGSAYECRPCRNGTASSAQQDFCGICPAGTAAAGGQAAPCPPCTRNTASFVAGSRVCQECGRGTHPNADHSECDTDCLFEVDANTKFNAQPLHNADIMYGPIIDSNDHQYFLSVCDRVPVNSTPCLDDNGDHVNSLLCQISSENKGVNIGDLLAFVPLPEPHHREGFNLTFSHGQLCGNGVERSGVIQFLCDPEAGRGYPRVPHGHENVETIRCKYEFVWSSLYACPICSVLDYSEVKSPCVGGKQDVTYVWREQPKRCVGGVGLPPNRKQDCELWSVSCNPGNYASTPDTCTPAPPGTFSGGNGEMVVVDTAMPLGFDNGCQGPACSLWVVENGSVLRSGAQTSYLLASRTFVFDGAVRFEYKYSGGPGAEFRFRVDNDVLASRRGSDVMFDYERLEVPVSKGLHSFEWSFRGGAPSSETEREHAVLVRFISFYNSGYAPVAPSPCPGGFAQPLPGQSECVQCGLNEWSGSGFPTCKSCLPEQYSMPGSRACKGRSPCRADTDYQVYYGPCVGGFRNMTLLPLQPVICYGEDATPPSRIACSDHDCPRGMGLKDGACMSCPFGSTFVAADKSCAPASPGTAAMRIVAYFEGVNGSPTFGSEWTTSCNGLCGSPGWRARGHMMDSGFHEDDEVDSVVTLSKTFAYDGYIEFYFTVNSAKDGLDFFIDKVRQKVYRPSDDSRDRYSAGSARFAVRRGAHEFTWAYHQSEGNSGSVMVERITLAGVTGGGTELVQCGPGTYSAANLASECSPCLAGTFSNSNNSVGCLPCGTGEFQPLEGQSKCEKCPQGAVTPSTGGAAFCTHSCQFQNPDKKQSWDLSAVRNLLLGPVVAPVASSPQQFYLQLCDPIQNVRVCNDTSGQAVATYICEVDPSTGRGVSAGTSMTQSVTATGDLELTYAGGSHEGCAAGETRTTVVVVQCNSNAGLRDLRSELAFVDGPCRRMVRVTGLQGCRACSTVFNPSETSNGDYSRVLSECVAGKQNITYVREALCSGVPTYTETIVCESQLPVPYYGVAVVFGLVMLLLAGVLVLIMRNRSMHRNYTQLLERHEGGVQMGALGGGGGGGAGNTSLVESSVDLENVTTDGESRGSNDVL